MPGHLAHQLPAYALAAPTVPTALLSWSDVSFELPVPRSLISKTLSAKIRSYLGPELMIYQWAHDKLHGVTEPGPEQGRMVEYIDAGGQPSKDMSRLWWDAVSRWLSQPSTVANKVVWQQRECIDEHGHLGKDATECEQQGIGAKVLPVVRFFGAGNPSHGQTYLGENSADGLVGFAERVSSVDAEDRLSSEAHDEPPQSATIQEDGPAANEAAHRREDADNARLADDDFDHRLVSYYAAAGPRSRRFEGIIEEASDVWTRATDPDADATFVAALRKSDEERGFVWPRGRTDPPFMSWEQRECYNKDWEPGKDYAMCQRHNVHVPSVHLYKIPKPSLDGSIHGVLPSVEFRGPRTVNGLIDFLRRETNVDEYIKNQQELLRTLFGSEGLTDSTEQGHATSDHQAQVQVAGAAAADKLYNAVNTIERLQAMTPFACIAATVVPTLAANRHAAACATGATTARTAVAAGLSFL